jgi:hypothetical protein
VVHYLVWRFGLYRLPVYCLNPHPHPRPRTTVHNPQHTIPHNHNPQQALHIASSCLCLSRAPGIASRLQAEQKQRQRAASSERPTNMCRVELWTNYGAMQALGGRCCGPLSRVAIWASGCFLCDKRHKTSMQPAYAQQSTSTSQCASGLTRPRVLRLSRWLVAAGTRCGKPF